MDKELTDLDSRIVKFLSKQERVELAYLFGSVAEGNAGKSNHPLVVRDEGQKINFEHMILSRYLDRRYYEKRGSAEFLKRVAERGI